MAVLILFTVLKVILWILLFLLAFLLYFLLVPWKIRGQFRWEEEEKLAKFSLKSFLHCFQLRLRLSQKEKVQLEVSFFWGIWKLFSYPGSKQETSHKKGMSHKNSKLNRKRTEEKAREKAGEQAGEKDREKCVKSKKSEKRRKNTKNKFRKMIKVLFTDSSKAAVKKILRELISFLRRLGLHFDETEIHFAGPGPDRTGQILGGLSMIPWIYQPGLKILPDFTADDAYFSGHGKIKGHLPVGILLLMGIRLLMDKNVRTLFHTIGGRNNEPE